jgi:hypothetical protein
VIPVSIGVPTLKEGATTSTSEFEILEAGPFSTVTLKVPPASIATPSNSVELLFNSALLAMMHVVEALHPGPLMKTITLFGSKPVPVIVNVKACEAAGGSGAVAIALS